MRPYRAIMELNPHYTSADQQAFVKHHEERFKSLRERTVAEFKRAKDIEQTKEVAYNSGIDQICDFLQFVAALFLPHRESFRVSWASDAPIPVLQHAYAVSDDPRSHQNDMTRRADVLVPLILTPASMKKIEDQGLLRIADMVDKEEISEYEDMLRRAIRWFARGERERHPDDRKLCYVTAIDLFFSSRGPGATKKLCKGFAFAMAMKPEAVPSLADYMLGAFISRCETSHEGVWNRWILRIWISCVISRATSSFG